MEEKKIISLIQDIFKDLFNDNKITIDQKTCAKDIKKWDSLNHVVLITKIEKKFNIKFSFNEISKFQKVGDIVSVILKKIT